MSDGIAEQSGLGTNSTPTGAAGAISRCWCGNSEFVPFSHEYSRCSVCQTLITHHVPAQAHPRVRDDENDFYGKNYWFRHQEQDLGFASIVTRARQDLTERCLHWLAALLRYKLPPAKVLEIGCAHGGFVAMLRAAGFDAMGLELSPHIVDFARRTFGIPMLLGPIEEQKIDHGSLDVIAMMDVLEHLPDPVGTLSQCARLLKHDGVLIIQTPKVPVGISYEQMVSTDHPFIEQFKAEEHLYLFTEQSAAELCRRAGLQVVLQEPAMFSQYDMFLFLSRSALQFRTEQETDRQLLQMPQGRIMLTWLDMDRQNRASRAQIAEIDRDRATRLDSIKNLSLQLRQAQDKNVEIEADRATRLNHIDTLTAQIKDLQARNQTIDADRQSQLSQILELSARLAELRNRNDEIETDRARRLDRILALTDTVKELQARMEAVEADRAKRLDGMLTLTAEVQQLQAKIAEIEADRSKRLEAILTLTNEITELRSGRA